MDAALLWSHPVIQILALILGCFAMYQGWRRVQMNYMKKRVIFNWKSHVRWGTLCLCLWIFGAFGFYITLSIFGATHITGVHAELAWYILALCVAGLCTGIIMDRKKRKRFWLPIIHGIINVALLILVIWECWTGYGLCESFL